MNLTTSRGAVLSGAPTVCSRRRFSLLSALSALLVLACSALNAANYEAEAASLSGAPAPSVVANGAATPPSPAPGNAVSGGYIYFNTDDGNARANFTVTAPSAGLYSLSIRYYVPNTFGEKFATILVDGVNIGEVQFWRADATSPMWATASVGNLSLAAGTHTITIQRSWGYYYIDYISFDALPTPDPGLHFEAENGALSGGTVTGTSTAGYSGTGYVTGFTNANAKLVLPVNLELTGQYRVYVRYTTAGSEKRTRVVFNGAELGEWTFPNSATWAEAGPFLVTAGAGISVLEFQNNWGWYDLDYVRFEYVVPPVGLEFEAESGSLFRAQVATARPGYSGTGYVTNFVQAPDAYVTIPVNVAAGGAYELVLRAATPNGTKMARIEVNGVSFGDASLNVATTSFMDFTGPKIFLREGVNMITIVANWGYYDVDKIRLVPVTIPPFKLNPTLVDKAASPEAIALYRYLVANFGKVIVSGQSEEATINANAPFVYLQQLTGKLPAIRNQDMIFQSSAGGWNDGTTPRGITWHKNQKGIIAMQWHWFAPLGPTEFYTAESTFDIEKVLTPGTPEHAAALVDIDLIAAQLGQYAANRVPILWRPLHEAEGGWFWWGAKGPGPAKALYRLMFDRLVNHHGLHNLVWVWNSRNPDWYPGDDVVDVVSVDIYNPARNYSPSPGVFLDIAQLGGYKKLVALAENGPIPHPDDMVEYKTMWSWFNTWNGMFIMNDGQNEGSHVNYVYHHPKVITLDELPDLRAAPAVTAYANTGYAGTSLGLPPGDYKRQHLVTRGATGGVIRSLKIPSGYRVTVYSGDNFTGTSKVLSANTTNLSTAGFSGPVGSMRIRRY